MRRLVAALAVVLLSALTLTACGGGSSSKGADLPTKVIDITIKGSDTDPSGQKIDLAVGQKIELDVTADKPGEIHVHSSPEEQEFEYKAGSNTFDVKPIEAPGQTVVESHTLDKVLFTLVAR
jgi:ABC-type glycerol-3-phosphate transport system substrate-binding protein